MRWMWVKPTVSIIAPPGSSSNLDVPVRCPSARATRSATVIEEVDEHVVAQRVGVGEERAPTVDTRHALDEVAQVVALVEHEGVDADAVARAPHHLLQRLLDRDRRRRVLEVRLAVLDVRGRLAVGDHDDLLRSALTVEL